MPFSKAALPAMLSLLLSACGPTSEAPTEAGQMLTADEVARLELGRSLAGQRVAITGYPLMCSMGRKYREDELVDMQVHANGSCKSTQLATIRIRLKSEGAQDPGMLTIGPRARNALMVGDNFSNENITFLTDDYQVIPARTPLRVSGLVSYPYGMSNTARLEAVSLNTAAP